MSPKLYIQIFIFLLPIVCFACATPDVDEGVNRLRPNLNTNTNQNFDRNANVAEDNEVELNSLITLAFEPEENVYKESEIDENDKSVGSKLIAVLKFKEEDAKALITQLKAKGVPFNAKVDPEPWFPAELSAKSEMTGDVSINGTGYNAESFFKDPYKKGTITHINETDYFVLILQTN